MTKKPKNKKDRPDEEIRHATLYGSADLRVEKRTGDNGEEGEVIFGYAAVFNQDSEDLGWFTESVDPGAFKETVKNDDIRALFDHDPSIILGRNRAKTLRLREDDTGLHMEIDVPETQAARDVVVSIRRRDITGASFGFRTLDDSWETKDGKEHRTLKRVMLFDVSPVAFPAYTDTEIALRSHKSSTEEQTKNRDDKIETEKRARELDLAAAELEGAEYEHADD